MNARFRMWNVVDRWPIVQIAIVPPNEQWNEDALHGPHTNGDGYEGRARLAIYAIVNCVND